MENNDTIIVWEAPKIVPPEFRLYYDEHGKVICYTCEKLEGNYIVIDKTTYAEARPDIRVVDKKISRNLAMSVITKLAVVNDNDIGVTCDTDDVSIIVNENYIGNTKKWGLKIYES